MGELIAIILTTAAITLVMPKQKMTKPTVATIILKMSRGFIKVV